MDIHKNIWRKGINVDIRAGKEKDRESQGKDRIRTSKKSKHEKTYLILVSIFLAAILFYTLSISQLLWGIVIDVLILRLYFLLRRERRYFRESDLNEDEAGTPHDPEMKKRIWIANMLITLFVLGLVIYSYFTSQFIWGVV
jgi:fatty acid desaturase